jgi:hypothetical protein
MFVCLLVALWFSTFSSYAAASDVRASVLLVILFAAGYSAVYGRGKQRAFWSGFALVLVLTGGNFFNGALNKYIPNFYWRTVQSTPTYSIQYASPPAYALPAFRSPMPAEPVPQPYAPTPVPPTPVTVVPATFAPAAPANPHFAIALNATIELLWTLALASIVGLIGVWVYSIAHRSGDRS